MCGGKGKKIVFFHNFIAFEKKIKLKSRFADNDCTELSKRAGPRLRELTARGQKEPGGRIHAIYDPLFCPALTWLPDGYSQIYRL